MADLTRPPTRIHPRPRFRTRAGASSRPLRLPVLAALTLSLLAPSVASAQPPEKLVHKLEVARQVYTELMTVPDRAAPRYLRNQARCIAVIPRLYKGAFGVGGRHGRGVLSCKDQDGDWSPPSFVKLSGGSIGFQVGFQASDVVLFFLTEGSVLSLLETEVALGGDASVAAGPAGRTAEATTDLKLRAEIYAYAKAKGLFAGVSIEGARLGPDRKSNRKYYGRALPVKTILFDHQVPQVPPEARAFLDVLP
jgi:lipid-binding SYLF domain-containing protein